MPSLTVPVKVDVAALPTVVALTRAAHQLLERSTREPEDQPTGTSLVGTDDLDALHDALADLAEAGKRV